MSSAKKSASKSGPDPAALSRERLPFPLDSDALRRHVARTRSMCPDCGGSLSNAVCKECEFDATALLVPQRGSSSDRTYHRPGESEE